MRAGCELLRADLVRDTPQERHAARIAMRLRRGRDLGL